MIILIDSVVGRGLRGEEQFIYEGWTPGGPFPAEFLSAASGVPHLQRNA
jgi:hypothetical protein